MRVLERGPAQVVDDTPGCLWLVGLWFAAGGILVLSMPFLAANRAELSGWERLLALGVGLAVLGAGVAMLVTQPATRTELDRQSGRGRVTVRAPGRRPRVEEFALAEVQWLEVRPGRDSDGDSTYELRLWLRGSRVVPLHARPLYGREGVEEDAQRIRAFLALDAPGPVRGSS